MPLYEYKAKGPGCEKCRDGFEILQKFGENLTRCPHCGNPCVRVLSPTHSIVKGSSKAPGPELKSGPQDIQPRGGKHQCGPGCSAHGYAKSLLDKKIKSG